MTVASANELRDTLDELRFVRRKLYSYSDADLSGMSIDDQITYGDNLHRIGVAILQLEAARLGEANARLYERRAELKESAEALSERIKSYQRAVDTIRAVSEGLDLLGKIIGLVT